MSRHIVQSNKAPAAVGPYSQGVEVSGTFYFSGMLGIDPQTGNLHSDFDGQLKQILTNIDGLLESQNLTRQHIVKTTIFMTDLSLFSKVNAAYETYFQKPYPARSTVQVSALPKGGTIEIEVVAVR